MRVIAVYVFDWNCDVFARGRETSEGSKILSNGNIYYDSGLPGPSLYIQQWGIPYNPKRYKSNVLQVIEIINKRVKTYDLDVLIN